MDTPDFKEHFSSLLTESEEHLSTLDQFLAERLESAIRKPSSQASTRFSTPSTAITRT